MTSYFNPTMEIFTEEVPVNIFNKIKNKIDFNRKIDANNNLAGNIQEEYCLNLEADEEISKYLTGICHRPGIYENRLKTFSKFLSNHQQKFRMKLVTSWVNIQKQYEFNPLHTHDGVFSFIIFIKIPYSFEEEIKRFIKTDPKALRPGCVCFLKPSMGSEGGLSLGYEEEVLKLNSSFEGKIYFFPANLGHIVYPFHTTTENRITVSGNIKLDIINES